LFYYQEIGSEVGGKLSRSNIPFTIIIQTPWQATMMQQYGHQSVVAINLIVGTNENKVNSFLVIYVVKPMKPLKHNET
jgi:hypothetical protein